MLYLDFYQKMFSLMYYVFYFYFLVDQDFSLANPTMGAKEVPQPKLFSGKLKTYQLKGMNWLANLYEQVRGMFFLQLLLSFRN